MPNETKFHFLEKLLSDEEREAIRRATVPGRFHPLAVLLDGQGNQFLAANTERALGWVTRRDERWLKAQKKRLLETATLTEPAAALAELRAYGALLEAGFHVSPFAADASGPKPEFKVRLNDEEMVVEVHSKQYDAAMAREIEKFHAVSPKESSAPTTSDPKPKVEVRVLDVQPFGRPRPGKPHDTTTTNAISKICRIKADEHQLTEGMPSLLWLDFQDAQNLSMALTGEHLSPVMSWQGFVNSGVLWYALYGWKGAPVFERHCLLVPFSTRTIVPMQHDGRFRLSQKLSAVVFSFPNATLLAESFRATAPVSDTFRRHFPYLPWAQVSTSIINWLPDQVKGTISLQARSICTMAGEPYYPPD
jgi:hypothetical protein